MLSQTVYNIRLGYPDVEPNIYLLHPNQKSSCLCGKDGPGVWWINCAFRLNLLKKMFTEIQLSQFTARSQEGHVGGPKCYTRRWKPANTRTDPFSDLGRKLARQNRNAVRTGRRTKLSLIIKEVQRFNRRNKNHGNDIPSQKKKRPKSQDRPREYQLGPDSFNSTTKGICT